MSKMTGMCDVDIIKELYPELKNLTYRPLRFIESALKTYPVPDLDDRGDKKRAKRLKRMRDLFRGSFITLLPHDAACKECKEGGYFCFTEQIMSGNRKSCKTCAHRGCDVFNGMMDNLPQSKEGESIRITLGKDARVDVGPESELFPDPTPEQKDMFDWTKKHHDDPKDIPSPTQWRDSTKLSLAHFLAMGHDRATANRLFREDKAKHAKRVAQNKAKHLAQVPKGL